MNSKLRARLLLNNGKLKLNDFHESYVEEIRMQSETVREDILLFSFIARDEQYKMDFSIGSLDFLEASVRKVFEEKVDSSEAELILRLAAIYLGRVICENFGGEWRSYRGQYLTYNQIVVFLKNSRENIDVFGYCTPRLNVLRNRWDFGSFRKLIKNIDRLSFK